MAIFSKHVANLLLLRDNSFLKRGIKFGPFLMILSNCRAAKGVATSMSTRFNKFLVDFKKNMEVGEPFQAL